MATVVAPATLTLSFTQPFHVRASAGGIYIRHADSLHEEPLHIKGAVWLGAQADGCPHALETHNVSSYLAFLHANGFNAVRLALSAHWLQRYALILVDMHHLQTRIAARCSKADSQLRLAVRSSPWARCAASTRGGATWRCSTI
jgi:hypothetical protein